MVGADHTFQLAVPPEARNSRTSVDYAACKKVTVDKLALRRGCLLRDSLIPPAPSKKQDRRNRIGLRGRRSEGGVRRGLH